MSRRDRRAARNRDTKKTRQALSRRYLNDIKTAPKNRLTLAELTKHAGA